MNAPQGTEAWRIERAGHVTASRFDDVQSKIKTGEAATRLKYRLQVVTERLTGVPIDGFQSGPMRWGTETEPFGRMAYEAKTGILAAEAPFRKHRGHAWIGASPDGEIDADGVLEIKCPESTTHVAWLQDGPRLPPEHVAQVQGVLWVTERRWCDFVSFDPRMPERLQLFVVRVARDDAYIAALEKEVLAFAAECERMIEQLNRLAA
jgi:YqaJ-like recombinase protein